MARTTAPATNGDRRVGAGDAPAEAAGSSPAADGERTIEDAAVTHPSAGARQPASLSQGSVPPGAASPAAAPRPVASTAGPGASPARTGPPTDPTGPGGRAGRANPGATGSERPPTGQSGSPVPPRHLAAPSTGAMAGGLAGTAGRGRSVAPAGLLSPPLDTETYSVEELASASGGTVAMVAELQDYGLISVRTVVGGTPYFDAAALAVARAAAGFARHGVEARHLRAWRNSADREAGLFEQVIMPLLRQRNPEARRQAAATLAELTSLGGDLRMALIDQAVRQIH